MKRARLPVFARSGALAIVAAAALVLSAGPALAAAGSLDHTFNGDGKATTRFLAGSALGYGVAVQPDGKVLVAGPAGDKIALARYTLAGRLDRSFGGDGRVVADLMPGPEEAAAVAIQTNGRIVVAGGADSTPSPTTCDGFLLARFLPDGTVDASFGDGGKQVTRFGGCSSAYAVAITKNGRIVAVGGAQEGFAVARYLPTGVLDPSFSGDGKITIGTRASIDWATGVAIQPNGKIVVVGGYDYYGFALARFNANGTRDAAFGRHGLVRTRPNGCGEGSAHAVALQGDRILVAGYTDAGHEYGDRCGPAKFALARYLPNGTLDPAFGLDGQTKTAFPHGGMANGVTIDRLGRIVAVGTAGAKFGLARYRANRALDPSFGGDGRVVTGFAHHFAAANGVAVAPGGRLVAAGCVEAPGGMAFAVARYRSA